MSRPKVFSFAMVSELREPPIVGRFYLVPAVFYVYERVSKVPDWYPVIGPKHDDAEHLNFEWPHYHLDRRFMSDRQLMRAASWSTYGRDTVAIAPIMEPPFGAHNWGPLPAPELRRMKCRRASVGFPATPRGNGVFPKFHETFLGKKCPRDAEGHLICPHKGARLTSLAPNEHGIITCPLHGLLIDPETETVVGGT